MLKKLALGLALSTAAFSAHAPAVEAAGADTVFTGGKSPVRIAQADTAAEPSEEELLRRRQKEQESQSEAPAPAPVPEPAAEPARQPAPEPRAVEAPAAMEPPAAEQNPVAADELPVKRRKKQAEALDPAPVEAPAAMEPPAADQNPVAADEPPVKRRKKQTPAPDPVTVEVPAAAEPPAANAPSAVVEQPASKAEKPASKVQPEAPPPAEPQIVVVPEPTPTPSEPASAPEKKGKEKPAVNAGEPTTAVSDGKASAEAAAILEQADRIPALSDDELRRLARSARDQMRNSDLTEASRAQVQAARDAAVAEMARRKAKDAEAPQTPQTPTPSETPVATPTEAPKVPGPVDAPAATDAGAPQPGTQRPKPDAVPTVAPDPAAPGEAAALLKDTRALSSLSDEELRQRLASSRALMRNPSLDEATKTALEDQFAASRVELQRRQTAKAGETPTPKPVEGTPTTPPPATAGGENKVVDTPVVQPEAERKAKAFLAEAAPADKLDDARLRARLEDMRTLLEAGDLSRETERALRERLRLDREALRLRVAAGEPGPATGPGADNKDGKDQDRRRRPPRPDYFDPFGDAGPSIVIVPPGALDRPRILADRRPSEFLEDEELYRRIEVLRDVVTDPRYPPRDRDYYASLLQEDRFELGRRYRDNRRARELVLARPLVVDRLYREYDRVEVPARRRPSVFAAEVDDAIIEQQLIAPPLDQGYVRVPRKTLRASPNEVMTQPSVRRALPGVEIDTINFGFNQAFVREEELPNLDRIGRILERIVAARPNEVFIIEGHTDAVGSDAYNLVLSRKRAEAVKQALLEYYVIDPANLETVGLGERYLKIPTPDPEQENRRVTIRRITDLIR